MGERWSLSLQKEEWAHPIARRGSKVEVHGPLLLPSAEQFLRRTNLRLLSNSKSIFYMTTFSFAKQKMRFLFTMLPHSHCFGSNKRI